MATRFYFKGRFADNAAPTTADLNEREAAFNFVDKALYIRDDSAQIVRMGLIEGAFATNKVPYFDGTKWAANPVFSLNAAGDVTANDVTVNSVIGDGSQLTGVDAETIDGLDSTDFVQDDLNGNYALGGVLYRDGTVVHNGFERFRKITLAAYQGLGSTDPNTVYLITD